MLAKRFIQLVQLLGNCLNAGFDLCNEIITELIVGLLLCCLNLRQIVRKLDVLKALQFIRKLCIVLVLNVIRHMILLIVGTSGIVTVAAMFVPPGRSTCFSRIVTLTKRHI